MADELVEFLATLEDYQPAIPDELVDHYLATGGFQSPDVRLTRLVGVATQKFITDIASDALHYCRLRQAGKGVKPAAAAAGSSAVRDKQLVLSSDDLAAALREFGVNFRRQEYYADSASAGMPAASVATVPAAAAAAQQSKEE